MADMREILVRWFAASNALETTWAKQRELEALPDYDGDLLATPMDVYAAQMGEFQAASRELARVLKETFEQEARVEAQVQARIEAEQERDQKRQAIKAWLEGQKRQGARVAKLEAALRGFKCPTCGGEKRVRDAACEPCRGTGIHPDSLAALYEDDEPGEQKYFPGEG